jgi:peptidoglycan/xylan/chitin deacetylase (PgdA/CDA1 family)
MLKLGFKKLMLKNRYGERILVFHGIDKDGKTCYNSRFFSLKYFESFISFISENYNIISLDDYNAKKFKPNTLNLALSFDDGYLNNFKYALPVLEKYKIPASFYITTIHENKKYLWADFLDLVSFYSEKDEVIFLDLKYTKTKKNEFVCDNISLKNKAKSLDYEDIVKLYDIFKDEWEIIQKKNLSDYWQLMNLDQIKEISQNPLFTIGAHGDTHVNLIKIKGDVAKKEILESKNKLDEICNTSITEFAFPFGYYTKELADFCLSNGYEKILLLDYNNKEDSQITQYKNRFMMNPYISQELQLVCLLKGNYF